MARDGPSDAGPPRPRERRPRWALALVAGIIGLGLCLCAALLFGQLTQATPEATAREFVSALSQHDFQRAYGDLSRRAQSEWAHRGAESAELNFARYAAALDRRYGSIERYTVQPAMTRGPHATVLVTVVRPGAHAEVDLLELVRAGNGWVVDVFSPGVPAASRKHRVDS
jgi:hypothetical protein